MASWMDGLRDKAPEPLTDEQHAKNVEIAEACAKRQFGFDPIDKPRKNNGKRIPDRKWMIT